MFGVVRDARGWRFRVDRDAARATSPARFEPQGRRPALPAPRAAAPRAPRPAPPAPRAARAPRRPRPAPPAPRAAAPRAARAPRRRAYSENRLSQSPKLHSSSGAQSVSRSHSYSSKK